MRSFGEFLQMLAREDWVGHGEEGLVPFGLLREVTIAEDLLSVDGGEGGEEEAGSGGETGHEVLLTKNRQKIAGMTKKDGSMGFRFGRR